jgi:hypothetical protein
MKNLALYEIASGIVTGTISADIVPAPADGYAYADYDPATDPRGCRVSVGKVVKNSLVVPVETVEQQLARMLDTIDEEREVRMMTSLTNGGAKKYEYAEKAREVRDYRSLAGAVIAGLLLPLNVAGTRDRFAWSMAEVDDTGDTLEVVITRYEAAMKRSTLARKVAARAQKLKRLINAAAPSARSAIYAGRTWPTS